MTSSIPLASRAVNDGPIASMDNYLVYRDHAKPMYSETILLQPELLHTQLRTGQSISDYLILEKIEEQDEDSDNEQERRRGKEFEVVDEPAKMVDPYGVRMKDVKYIFHK